MTAFPPRRVLVAVDLSPISADVWNWASFLAGRGARVEALYVRELEPAPIMGLPAAPLTAAGKARLLKRLRALCRGARARVEEGDPVRAILRAARGADVVVMGTNGRRGLSRMLLGSVCEGVVRLSPVPVLAVRARRAGPSAAREARRPGRRRS
jgi:nucleotide-binding universal stress UspA family protein